nr:helix-turn-helix transcriptional regulator [Vibrio mexicanus]
MYSLNSVSKTAGAELVQTNLNSLLSGEQGMNQKLLEVLTPSEMQVAEFIRSGMSSQEIANNLNVARKTVENHRNSLRNKLGIKNRGVNLRNYLLSLEQ